MRVGGTNARSLMALTVCWGLLSCIAVSCAKRGTISDISLPLSTRISTEGRFAVVSEPYVSLRDIPGSSGITVAHARRGDILSVKGKRLVPDGKTVVVWLDLGSGWVVESSVKLYSSESRAMNASRLIEADSPQTR